MNIKQLSDHFAILDEPRKPYAYRSNKMRYKLLKSDRPWSCEQCGSINKLEAHHIKPISYLRSPSNYSYQDPHDNHDLSNGKILCNTCHHKLHNTK